MSLLLRAGVPVEEIVDQAKSIRPCKAYTDRTKSKGDTSKGTSCPSAIGNALIELRNKINDRMFDFEVDEVEDDWKDIDTDFVCTGQCDSCQSHVEITTTKPKGMTCTECGSELRNEGGCVICMNCGWTKCE